MMPHEYQFLNVSEMTRLATGYFFFTSISVFGQKRNIGTSSRPTYTTVKRLCSFIKCAKEGGRATVGHQGLPHHSKVVT